MARCNSASATTTAFLLLMLLHAANSSRTTRDEVPIAIPRGCRNRCYRVHGPAFHDCRYRSRPVAGCQISRCVFNDIRKELGWVCENIPSSPPSLPPSPPPPTPRPSDRPPIVIPRGCRNRCYRAYGPAFHDCRYNKRPVAGCQIARCRFNEVRKEPGWACEPVPLPSQSASPPLLPSPSDRPPIVIPRGCRNRCYRAYGPAFHDCRYNKRPVAGCYITRCKVNPIRKIPGWVCAPMPQ